MRSNDNQQQQSMLSPINLLLITAVLCIVMVLVLASLAKSDMPGVKEWIASNILAFSALVLYALRGIASDFFTVVIANALLATAMASVYVGFRRFFQLAVPFLILTASLAFTIVGVALFHYGHDSISVRVIVVSLFHGAVSLCTGLTIIKADQSFSRRYAYRFTACMAFLFAFGHLVRAIVYASGFDILVSSVHATFWNLVFLSIGTLVLPIYTMGAVMMVQDRMLSKALDDANRDFLTSVWSRRAFFDIAERELERFRRMNRPLCLLVFDVDHFKRLNDTYGHAAGDKVLTAIARRSMQEVRSMDSIARIGGEEFAVLLPEADSIAAVAIADRLRESLNMKFHFDLTEMNTADPLSVSVSIGVAVADRDDSISELMRKADKALYEAKAAGRNTVALAA